MPKAIDAVDECNGDHANLVGYQEISSHVILKSNLERIFDAKLGLWPMTIR